MNKLVTRFFVTGLTIGSALWVNNSSFFLTNVDQHETRIIAHRGIHQNYIGTDRSRDSCHAAPVAPLQHRFIENTIPSMREAFRLGADIVEIDVHLTVDNEFVVFHDWTLDCRTNGSGITRKQSVATLKSLDVGYRIDDGTGSYPLRGRAIGQMPLLSEVFDANLDGQFLINFKSRRKKEGTKLAELLDQPRAFAQTFGVYGGGPPTRTAIDATAGLRGFDIKAVKSCLLRYWALGWSGYVPQSCRNTIMMIPSNYAPFLWGWPHRFTRRLKENGTNIILVGAYDGSGFSSGIDDAKDLEEVPVNFDGYVWTDRIETIGPLISSRE